MSGDPLRLPILMFRPFYRGRKAMMTEDEVREIQDRKDYELAPEYTDKYLNALRHDIDRLLADRAELVALVGDMDAELALLSDGEQCDHDVGICWCPLYRLRDRAKAVTGKASACTCPTECDCENPEPERGPALVSQECPVHNFRPRPAPGCPVHDRAKAVTGGREGT